MTWKRVVRRAISAPSRGGQKRCFAFFNESFIELDLNEFCCQFPANYNESPSGHYQDSLVHAKLTPKSLAGKPLAGFDATRSGRIQVLYGMVILAIPRCNDPLLSSRRSLSLLPPSAIRLKHLRAVSADDATILWWVKSTSEISPIFTSAVTVRLFPHSSD